MASRVPKAALQSSRSNGGQGHWHARICVVAAEVARAMERLQDANLAAAFDATANFVPDDHSNGFLGAVRLLYFRHALCQTPVNHDPECSQVPDRDHGCGERIRRWIREYVR